MSMAQKFFFLSIHNLAYAEAEFNTFLRTHTVLSMERHWVDHDSCEYPIRSPKNLPIGFSDGPGGIVKLDRRAP